MRQTILFLFLIIVTTTSAQYLPQTEGKRMQYGVTIDFGKAYVSGICIMMMEQQTVKSSIVNEFGISAIDFTYTPQSNKVRIVNVMSKLNKWYIKRTLKHDLRCLMQRMNNGQLSYRNDKRNITYTLSPLHENDSIQ